MQLFVISNGALTKSYSNTVREGVVGRPTTREGHLSEQSPAGRGRKKTSNSFSFTSWWADAMNRPITDLSDFTKTNRTGLSTSTIYRKTADGSPTPSHGGQEAGAA